MKTILTLLLCFMLTSCNNPTISDYESSIEPSNKSYQSSEISSPLLLSSFTTPILTTDPDRYFNISLVGNKLNGYRLENKEEFSFNEVCGPYNAEEGFKKATILLSNGEHDEGYGGGVCQLSSTLYNAVKNLNIDITERHHHSIPIDYVPENEDATVSGGSNLDFKFINHTGKQMLFKVDIKEKEVTVNVYHY